MPTRIAVVFCFLLTVGYINAASPEAVQDEPSSNSLDVAQQDEWMTESPDGLLVRVGLSPAVEVTAGVAVGGSSGDAGFTIESYGLLVSELTYPLDGTMVEFTAAVTYREPGAPWGLRVSGSYMMSASASGTSTDEDFDYSGRRLHFSKADCDVEVAEWNIDGALLVQPLPQHPNELLRSMELGFIVGYGASSMDFEDSNLLGSYYYGTQPVSSGGLVATYDLDFEGMRIGVSADAKPAPKFDVGASVIFIPSLEARSEAFWVLRDYPFSQTAEGNGVIWEAHATYQLTAMVEIRATYRHVELIADENGLESGLLNGIIPYYDEPIVGEMTSTYDLVEVGLGIRF